MVDPGRGASSAQGATRVGSSKCCRLEVGGGQRLAGEDAGRREVTTVKDELTLRLQFALQHEHAQRPVPGIEGRGQVDEGTLVVAGNDRPQALRSDRVGLRLHQCALASGMAR
jgi:hypothetical protein